jgi:hypothetical protein
VQALRQLAVAHAGGHRNGVPLAVDVHHGRQVGQRDQVAGGVDEPVERVAAAHRAYPLGVGDQLLELRHRARPVQPSRPVPDVARPVGHPSGHPAIIPDRSG